jgi:hypothetical protein
MLSIHVRNFAPPNEPLNIKKKKLYKPQNHLPRMTLWCKNHENPSDGNSHTWAPLTIAFVGLSLFCAEPKEDKVWLGE